MTNQTVGPGGTGVIIAGNSNTVTINSTKNKVDIPLVLPYSVDRQPQLSQVDQLLVNLKTMTAPQFFFSQGHYNDAAEKLARRIHWQHLDPDQTLYASVNFSPSKDAASLIARWVRNLHSQICSLDTRDRGASKQPVATMSPTQCWDKILETAEQQKDKAIFISCIAVDNNVIKMHADIWKVWLDTIAEQFQRLESPSRVKILVALTPQSSAFGAPLVHLNLKRVAKQLTVPHPLLNTVDLKPFEAISRDDCLDWADDYFFPWLQEKLSSKEVTVNDDNGLKDDIKQDIHSLFAASKSMPLRQVGDQLKKRIRARIKN